MRLSRTVFIDAYCRKSPPSCTISSGYDAVGRNLAGRYIVTWASRPRARLGTTSSRSSPGRASGSGRTQSGVSYPAPKQTDGSYAGTLYRTTGPVFSANPFDPERVVATDVGTASLVFTNGNAGTFTWSFEGVTRSTPITRQIFVSPGTVCQ